VKTFKEHEIFIKLLQDLCLSSIFTVQF